jgi:RND superfamily putative drug exporter
MSAGVLIVKAFGLGIAVAAFVDAFLIRTILVPSTMTLVKHWNWYCPKWLLAILPKISFDTSSAEIKKRQQQRKKG